VHVQHEKSHLTTDKTEDLMSVITVQFTSTPDKKVFFSVNIAVILTTGKPVRLSQTLNKLESCINLSNPNPE
jgi:hypothetical protein